MFRPRPRNPYRLPVSIAAALVALALTMAPLPAAAQVLSLETRPDLSISLSASPNPVAPGGSVAFSMLVRNQLSTVNGTPNRTVKGIGVAYALPAGFVVQSLTADRGFTCSNATGSVTCTGGVLDPGQVGRITVNVKAARNAGTFAGTAVVDPLKTIDERNERNNAATASVVVPRADLSLVIRPTRSTVGDGEAFEYRVHVSNADGGVDATGASLR
ncbi:MAG: CARDB domain-containing protein, partial [Chloroflexota bacterium]